MNPSTPSPVVLSHSVVADNITTLRARDTDARAFRQAAHAIARALAYEATRDLPLEPGTVETPLETAECGRLRQRVIAVPILRAGLWMLDAFLEIVPDAAAGFVGLRRNEETLQPYEYYRNVPDIAGAHVFLLDPMLATGGSTIAALAGMRAAEAASVSLLSIIAAPEGVAALQAAFPLVRIHIAALDRQLSPSGYILPGLGDAGDRLCDTL